MNGGVKDIPNTAGEILAAEQSVQPAIAEMIWNLAQEAKQERPGDPSIGAHAEIADASREMGRSGLVGVCDKRPKGSRKLTCRPTVRAGQVVCDVSGIPWDPWDNASTGADRLARRWRDSSEGLGHGRESGMRCGQPVGLLFHAAVGQMSDDNRELFLRNG